MIGSYNFLMRASTPILRYTLRRRSKKGKENPKRLGERMGIPGKIRPEGQLIWIHGASVGEAQSAIILIDALKKKLPAANFLITTGTVTSAELMEQRLPEEAFHQFYPLDHPLWVQRFLSHWQPDLVLWMESEIWPAMLCQLRKQEIPAALINARLSSKSFKRWKRAGRKISDLLATFGLIVAQTPEDASRFEELGAGKVVTADNLKYAASPLPYNENDLQKLKAATVDRPIWLYASTHNGEEDLAARIHRQLKKKIPDLLTIIVPRHPERGERVATTCKKYELKVIRRGSNHSLPKKNDDIYVADTLGELGLFYRLAPLACIGRSFSSDGGGGHNPIEAAQLGCAILHGPHVQNLAQIYQEMDEAGAALKLKSEKDFHLRLERLLTDTDGLSALQNKASNFAGRKAGSLSIIIDAVVPWIKTAKLHLKTGE